MFKSQDQRTRWLALGFLAGLAVSFFWPHEPLQASATDRSSQFGLCTGKVSIIDPIEGVYVLDFLTGQLKGAVMNRQIGKFTAFYFRDVAKDLAVDPQTKPSYAMVTGDAQLTARGGSPPATGLIYVAELTSGKVAAYTYEWRETTNLVGPLLMVPIDVFQFRAPLVK